MTLVRVLSLIGVAVLVMVLNIVASILYMVVYGHLINPGHPKEFYDQHVQSAAPFCSIIAGIPVGRLGKPEEIAALVTFIASEAAGFMTGSNVAMNGGQHMY